MTGDMIEFFLGCIAKDEAVANAAWHGDGWKVEPNRQADEVWTNEHAGPGHAPIPIAKAWDEPTARHIAGWDPGRALEQCRANRRLIQRYQDAVRQHEAGYHERFQTGAEARLRALTEAIRYAIQPYAGQDGWREEWRG